MRTLCLRQIIFLLCAGSLCARVKWVITWPLGLLLYCTVPNCILPRWHRWFMVTFVASTLWIAVFSYLMVWMVSRRAQRALDDIPDQCIRWLLVSSLCPMK